MSLNFKKRVFFIIPFLISGCDSDPINKVKDTIIHSVDNSLTIGDAFKTRSDCNNGEWGEKKDSRGRYIVSYTCAVGDNGVSAINQYLLKYPTSWASEKIKSAEYLIGLSEKESLEEKHSVDIINKQKKNVDAYIDRLYSAFIADDLISEKLYFGSYLENMFSLMRLGSRVKVDSLCYSDDYVNDAYYDSSRSEIDPKYVQDSCIKNIKPVFEGFEKDVKQNLDVSYNLYDFYANLSKVIVYTYSIDAQKEAIDEYFNKALLRYEESEKNKIKIISEMKGNIENSQKQLALLKKELQVSDVNINYKWMVSPTGAIDYLGAEIDFKYNGIKKLIAIGNVSFIKYAYQEFSNGEIPSAYAEKIFDDLRYDIGDKKSLFN